MHSAANLTPPHDPPAYTVESFCTAHHIARSYFYILKRRGKAPETYKLGRRTYISGEAAAAWRRRMQNETSGSSHLGGSHGR